MKNDENMIDEIGCEEVFTEESFDLGGALDNAHEDHAFRVNGGIWRDNRHDIVEDFESLVDAAGD